MNASQLMGLSREIAECYGKPHVGAFYANSSVNSHKLQWDAVCTICGRPATNAHHQPPKSRGIVFTMRTPMGAFVLKPALIAVCGSGTTGCHGLIHQGLIRISWEWDEDEALWWDGQLLRELEPHSNQLYNYGHWLIETRQGRKEHREAF